MTRDEKHLGIKAYRFVTSSNDGEDASPVEGVDGIVHGLGTRSAEGHVHDGLADDAAALNVLGDELHALEDAISGTAAVASEDLDADKFGFLGHAKGGAGDGAGDVAAVAVGVVILMPGSVS